MMSSLSLTERQRRELEFYEEYSELTGQIEVCFDPIAGTETRPWNSYWRVIEIVRENFISESQRLLDFGCGKGGSSVTFAKIGYEVFGFDLAPNNISIAERLAQKYGVSDRIHLSVGVAEKLNYPAEHFDMIVGTDILHHVDISQSLAECSRVLKKGGLAVFHEPVRVPLFDRLRETRLGRWLVPKEASLDRHLTHDERKLARPAAEGSALRSHLLVRLLGVGLQVPAEPLAALEAVTKAERQLAEASRVCDPCSINFHLQAGSACARAADLPRARRHLAAAERGVPESSASSDTWGCFAFRRWWSTHRL